METSIWQVILLATLCTVAYGDLQCDLHQNITNGEVTHIADIGVIIYECHRLYELVGDSVRVCEDGGTWSGRQPYCEPICGRSSVPQRLPHRRRRIVGGQEAAAGSWPWMAFISLIRRSGPSFCGGSLLNEEWIATTAACVSEEPLFEVPLHPENITVVLGLHDRTQPNAPEGVTMRIDTILLHPEYDHTLYDADLALLHLTNPVILTDRIRPLCLPSKFDEESTVQMEADVGIIIGWGSTQEYVIYANTLREAYVDIVYDNNKCQSSVTYPVTDRMICAGSVSGDHDACQGDSGGPLMTRRITDAEIPTTGDHIENYVYVLRGIISWGEGCAQPGKLGVYTNVVYFTDWIRATIDMDRCGLECQQSENITINKIFTVPSTLSNNASSSLPPTQPNRQTTNSASSLPPTQPNRQTTNSASLTSGNYTQLVIVIIVVVISICVLINLFVLYRMCRAKQKTRSVPSQDRMLTVISQTQKDFTDHSFGVEHDSNTENERVRNIDAEIESRSDALETENDFYEDVKEKNDIYENVKESEFTFPRENLQIIRELGSGQYGCVFLADADGINVAVKTLKENATTLEKDNLLSELRLLKMLKSHPNVLGLMGCCVEKDPLYIIVQFMANGDLKNFLVKSRIVNNSAEGNRQGMQSTLSPAQLMLFARQVADGMAHIAAQQCIHRDLAARNILVGEDLVCKVSDFGLARDIMNMRIYERRSDAPLPIRWMAVESLVDDIFTTESDVWSFGIVLWEIITLGARPYPSIFGSRILIHKLRSGYRMRRRRNCSQELYDVMASCWAANPSMRPTFNEISRQLDAIIEKEADYLTLDDEDDFDYDDVAEPEASERI